MKRALFYFIIFDLAIASFSILNFNLRDKDKDNGITHPIISSFNHFNNSLVTYFSTPKTTIPQQQPIIISQHRTENTDPICIVYGPLNLEQKTELDIIMNKSFISPNLVTINQMPLFEIYWNLGDNKNQAIKLFEEQKNNGALQDEKFKLSQEHNGNWIVSIATISGDMALAQKMTSELSQSSHKYGGRWQYRNKNNGYFYQFKDITKIPDRTINIINHSINVLKAPC